MSIMIDLIVILIIALTTFLGYKQGLVKAVIKILSFFIAIIIAILLYKPISNIVINNTTIDDKIKNTITDKIKPEEMAENEEIDIQNSLVNKMIGEASNTVENISNAFAIKLIESSVLLLIFIAVKISLRFVSAFTDLITKLPIIKQANKLRRNNIWNS